MGLGAFLRFTEKKFLDRFVIKYQNHIPQLLNLFKGEVGILELGFASEEISERGTKNPFISYQVIFHQESQMNTSFSIYESTFSNSI
ncbi:unnamed protein product, partial [Vitis vinifera]